MLKVETAFCIQIQNIQIQIKNCTSIQTCYMDKYYETSLERVIASAPFLTNFCKCKGFNILQGLKYTKIFGTIF